MKTFLVILVSTLLSFSAIQAQWKSSIKGDGNVITQKRDVESFTSIVLHTNVNVSLIKGKEGAIALKGEKNILEHLELTVKNNVLNIRTKKNVSLKPSAKNSVFIEIPITTVSKLEVNGSGEIIGTYPIKGDEVKLIVNGSGDLKVTLNAKEVKASVTGSGDIKINGMATSIKASVTGSGDIDSKELHAHYAKGEVTGSGDLYLTATEQLEAFIVGSGDISINGDVKKIKKNIVGSGDLNKR